MTDRSRFLHRPRAAFLAAAVVAALFVALVPVRILGQVAASGWKVIAWNNLGMHCMDADFSVFAILPPYNTIQAQVIDPAGHLATSASGIRLTYQGVADPAGSINTTSVGKTNFWSFVAPLFGPALPSDTGLVDHNMPGPANAPQPMVFDSALKWFIAEGIPITPYDDAGAKNYYPLMQVSALDSAGATLASTRIVLPVSDEMDCSSCHASGTSAAARPAAGWVNVAADRQRDYRLNILRLHDDRHLGTSAYTAALGAKGYGAAGLYATASGGTPILCAACHASEALAGSGIAGIPPLTSSIHTLHAHAIDPTSGLALGSSANRSACYRCHPGSETRCLRGAMGSAVAADGSLAMQCQNCHGSMSTVGAPTRTGWLQEPTCQNCHTGTAMANSGAIRFTSAFDATGLLRVPAASTFATTADSPAPGLSLYRFSAGHGGLQCAACHGSTHAEYASSHPNDNLQSVSTQGHVGTIAECTACHATTPSTTNGGPHGMHPVGASWVSRHGDVAEGNRTQCQACHGADYRGTVLSRSFASRTLTTSYGTKQLFRGAQVGCYACHNGPGGGNANPNRPPVATSLSAATTAGTPVAVALVASDPDGNALTLRIVSQPANGTVGLSGATATYFPFAGFGGTDRFTYAAWDGAIDSNLATVTVTAAGPPACDLQPGASVPSTATAGVAVPFLATTAATNCTGAVSYDWNFGDGSLHSTAQAPAHVYTTAATFTWTLTVGVGATTSTQRGTIVVTAPPQPSTIYRRYFAEGAATASFDTWFALANPGAMTANVHLRFLRNDGVVATYDLHLPPMSRRTLDAGEVPGLAPAPGFATVVESDVAIVADRTMTWPGLGNGAHAEASIPNPSATWYLAEGATFGGFKLYYTIANPNAVDVPVEITYLRPAGRAPVVKTYLVGANSRMTVFVNVEDPSLAATNVSAVIKSLDPASPIIVERSMYLSLPGQALGAGHNSAGVPAPAAKWFLAEGATGALFDLYVLIANPGPADAAVKASYLLPDGSVIERTYPVAANSRATVWVNGEDPRLAFTSVSTTVESTNQVPIVVERAMWWPRGNWSEAHASSGTTDAGTAWALAEGEQGGANGIDTYILVANTSTFAGTVRVTLLMEDGSAPWVTLSMPPTSRTTLNAAAAFGSLVEGRRFGAIVESLPTDGRTAAIVVERAMYWNPKGLHWAAGTDALATRLR